MTSVTLDPNAAIRRRRDAGPNFNMKTILSLLLVCLGWDCFGQAQPGVTNRFAFPALAGVRLREANIAPGTNDSGNSALYGVPANYYDQDYYWTSGAGPSGDEWDHWIVPQVLAAKAAGANCIRMMWSADAFIGDSTHHGAAAWVGTNTYTGLTNEIGMMASLCQSNGLWFYPACSESRVINDGNLPTNMVYLYISNFVACVSTYDNVPGIDVIQEADGAAGGTNGFVAQDCFQWIAAARAGMAAAGRSVPLTCSMNGAAQASDLNVVNRWQAYNLAAAGVNYLDLHAYYQYTIADFYQAVTNKWNLPVVIGESGINMSGVWGSGPDNEATHPYSSEIRQDFFFAAAQPVAEQPYFQLDGVWAIAPNWLTNEEDFGLYGGAQNGSYQLTQSRDQLRNFAMFPTNVLSANYLWSVCCTGVNTTASSYGTGARYAVGSAMLDVSSNNPANGHGIWQRQNNLVQALGATSAANFVGDGSELLWQTALPPATGEYVQFDIPPQSPTLYNSEFATWGVFLRGQSSGNGYIVELTSDNGHTYDNKVDILSYTNGVRTDLTNITYGSALDLTKWWRFTVSVSTNVSPTTITCTVSNMSASTVMSPPLMISDSTASLQCAGGMALSGYFGQPYYTNINFSAIFDNAPTIATAPAGASAGASVALSWSAAAGGSGTINYTPQYNVSDPFGFPCTMTWTNAPTVPGLNETVSSLPAMTNLIFRVMAVDATSATNYSPWLTIATGVAGSSTNTYVLFHY